MAAQNIHEAPFSRKAIFWLVLVGLVATFGFTATSVFQGDGQYETSSAADSFSKSAIGHAAFADLLRQNGWKILQSQYETANKLTSDAALLVIEPRYNLVSKDRFEDLAGQVPMLLVLPKRAANPDPLRPDWVGRQKLMDLPGPTRVLRFMVEKAEMIRLDKTATNWHSPILPDRKPDISDLQLMKSDTIEPVIWADEGILLGKYVLEGDAPVWILSDPDLLATHGLNRGWNADFAVGLAGLFADGAGTLVIDEVMHGYTLEPSLLRAMFRAPFLAATLAFLLAMISFLLATTRRFGAPFRTSAAPVNSKAVFIENSVRLLGVAGKEHEALMRLLDEAALQVASGLNVPAGLERHRLEAWLDEKARLRGIAPDFTTLKRRLRRIREDDDTRRRRLLIISNQIYTWKREMLRDPK